MATVPRLDMTGTVGGALPSARQSSVASPDLFASEGAKDVAFGESIARASDPIARIALEEAEKNAVTQVQAARTELGSRTQTYFEEMRKNNVGAAAAGVTQAFRDWHKKQAEEIGKGLTGDVQRAFVQQAGQHGLAARGEAANFEHGETVKYRADVYKRTNDGFVQEGANAKEEMALIVAKDGLRASVRARGLTEKWDEKQLESNMRDELTRFHRERADVLSKTDPQAALRYLSGVDPKELDASTLAKMKAEMKPATDAQLALDTTNEVLAANRPAGKNDPMMFEKIDVELRKRFSNNPQALQMARAEARQQIAVYNAEVEQVQNKSLASAWEAFNSGASLAAIAKQPFFKDLAPKAQNDFRESVLRQQTLHEQRAAAAAGRLNAEEERAWRQAERQDLITTRSQRAKTYELSSEEVLRATTYERLYAQTGSLGRENVEWLASRKKALETSPDKAREAKLDEQTFQAMAINAGLHPKEKAPSEAEKNTLVLIQRDIERRINLEQSKTKQPLPPERKAEIAQKAFDAKILEPGFFGGTPRIIGSMKDEDLAKLIPLRVYKTIESGLQKDGKKPTQAAIVGQFRLLHAERELDEEMNLKLSRRQVPYAPGQ